jgi:hypothetical protein
VERSRGRLDRNSPPPDSNPPARQGPTFQPTLALPDLHSEVHPDHLADHLHLRLVAPAVGHLAAAAAARHLAVHQFLAMNILDQVDRVDLHLAAPAGAPHSAAHPVPHLAALQAALQAALHLAALQAALQAALHLAALPAALRLEVALPALLTKTLMGLALRDLQEDSVVLLLVAALVDLVVLLLVAPPVDLVDRLAALPVAVEDRRLVATLAVLPVAAPVDLVDRLAVLPVATLVDLQAALEDLALAVDLPQLKTPTHLEKDLNPPADSVADSTALQPPRWEALLKVEDARLLPLRLGHLNLHPETAHPSLAVPTFPASPLVPAALLHPAVRAPKPVLPAPVDPGPSPTAQ